MEHSLAISIVKFNFKCFCTFLCVLLPWRIVFGFMAIDLTVVVMGVPSNNNWSEVNKII